MQVLGWTTAADVMETHVSTASAAEPAADAGLRMVRQKIGCLPVVAPPGSRNSSLTGDPVPDTPGIARSPSTADSPSSSAKRAWMIFLVFVLCTRTSASRPAALIRPSSTANGPIADDILPQLPL